MPKHRVEGTSRHKPDQLFALAGDVRRYPEFVPWVKRLRVWNERTLSPTLNECDAEATVGFAFFSGAFGTRVRRDSEARVITTSLLSGPFKRLENRWTFLPEGEGSRVVFEIDFEFRSRLLQMLLDANFDHAVNKLMACFEGRADALYGAA